jgi:hypothetical protein
MLKNDKWIKAQAAAGMIEPFEPESCRYDPPMPSFQLTNDIVYSYLSRDDAVNLVEACQKPGPWERRYAPIEAQRHLCKEVVITCYTDGDLMIALVPPTTP